MRNVMITLSAAIILCQILHETNSFRVLGLFPLPIKSHYIFYQRFMAELAKRGHEVHVVNHFPQKHPIPKYFQPKPFHIQSDMYQLRFSYYDIDIGGSLPKSVGQLSVKLPYHRGHLGKMKYIFRTCGSEICEYLFRHLSIIDLKNSTMKFDVVIAEVYGTDCLLAFAHHFQAPIVGISAVDLLPWAAERMGNPHNPSHVPNYFVATNENMILHEKLLVLASLLFSKIGYFLLSTAASEIKIREFFGSEIPSLETIVANTSLILVNSHLSVNIPRPMVPNIIEIGGLHIKSPNVLSRELDQLVKTSPAGVIYFSMGTVVDLKSFEVHVLQNIMNGLGKMPQTVIWSGKIGNITVPRNVHIYPWVEQLDILCDPHTKVFITLGGLMSLQEAAYCSLPILGISIFPDHKRNINKYVNSGAGLVIEYSGVSEEALTSALDDLITNPDYKQNAVRLSKIFKERPMSALDTAVYWTEYIVKFGGARHLRCKSADLVWFEYYLVDCAIIIMGMIGFGFLSGAFAIYILQNYFDDMWYYNILKTPPKKKEGETKLGNETDKDK